MEQESNNVFRLDDERIKQRTETVEEQMTFVQKEITRVIADSFPGDKTLPDRRQMYEEVAAISVQSVQDSLPLALQKIAQIAEDSIETDQQRRFLDKLRGIAITLQQSNDKAPKEFLALAYKHFRNFEGILKRAVRG